MPEELRGRKERDRDIEGHPHTQDYNACEKPADEKHADHALSDSRGENEEIVAKPRLPEVGTHEIELRMACQEGSSDRWIPDLLVQRGCDDGNACDDPKGGHGAGRPRQVALREPRP